jgi:hypothetical protein
MEFPASVFFHTGTLSRPQVETLYFLVFTLCRDDCCLTGAAQTDQYCHPRGVKLCGMVVI